MSKITFILMVLLIKSCMTAESSERFSHLKSTSTLQVALVKILKSCFAERLNPTVIIGDLRYTFYQDLSDGKAVATISTSNHSKAFDVRYGCRQLSSFIVTANSVKELQLTLLTLRTSPWWNHKALFIVFGPTSQSCESPSTMLHVAWKMNILSSLFLCQEDNQRVTLYTFNPFTNWAPNPWKKMEITVKLDDRFTVYKQLYLGARGMCRSLNFDKTKFMDGYQIRGVASTDFRRKWIPNKNYNISSLMQKTAFLNAAFSTTVLTAMNVTPIIHYDDFGQYIDGKPVGYMPKVMNGTYDVVLNLRVLSNPPRIQINYPYLQTGMVIITQKREFLSTQEKIAKFYSREIIYLSSIVLLITFAMMIINSKQKVGSAFLDLLRLILSTSILQPLDRISMRIYIFNVLLLVLVLNATFQGNVLAFLTKPERHNVEKMSDLKEYGYHLYGFTRFLSVFDNDTLPEMRYVHHLTNLQCFKYPANDKSAACLGIPHYELPATITYGLHAAQSDIGIMYGSFWFRDNWPLAEKFDGISSRLKEAGILDYFYICKLVPLWEKLRVVENQATAVQHRPLGLNDLIFAFQFLAVGLACSSIVFVIELFLVKKFSRCIKKWRNLLSKKY